MDLRVSGSDDLNFTPRFPYPHGVEEIAAAFLDGAPVHLIGWPEITAPRGGIHFPIESETMNSLDATEATAVLAAARAHLAKVTGKRNRAQDKVEVAKKAVAQALREYERSCHPEPPTGSIIAFNRKLGNGTYSYAAVRIGTAWFTTGRGDDGVFEKWSELLSWMGPHGLETLKVLVLGR